MKRVIASFVFLLGMVSINHKEGLQENINETEFTLVTVDKVDVHHPAVIEFMNMIAQIESGGRYDVTNRFGYMGRYQFSPTTVEYLGYDVGLNEFLNNHSLQDTVMFDYMYYHNKNLKNLINRYDGRVINGIKINRAVILAGAHFAGAGGIKNFLVSNGENTTTDANNMSVKKYISNFSDMELPSLITS